MFTRRTSLIGGLALCVLVTLGAVVLSPGVDGHSEPYIWVPPPTEPPPPPSPAEDPIILTELTPLRWSWVHWWESNRWAHLTPLRQGGPGQAAGDIALAERRANVLEVLALAVTSDDAPVRRAGAMAYGRLRAPEGVRPLVTLLEREPEMLNRMIAATSLGTIGTPEAQRLVLAANYPDDATFAGAVVGLGLAEQLAPESERGLRSLVGRGGIVGYAAIWALGQHAPSTGDALFDVVRNSPSVWNAVEAQIDLGTTDDAAAGRLLARIATNRDPKPDVITAADVALDTVDRQVNAFALAGIFVERSAANPGGVHQQFLDLLRPIMDRRPDLRPLTPGWRKHSVALLVTRYDELFRGRLRAAAVQGMSRRSDDGTARAILDVANGDEGNPFEHLPMGMALIAIGERGLADGLDRTIAIVDAPDARSRRQQVLLDSPLRGFGAIALGLYARPVETPQGTQNRPGWERCIDVLLARAADPDERTEVRSAAAVALGITRRTEVLPGFADITASLRATDLPLAGYVVMGRSMLGDGTANRDAIQLLDAPPHRDEVVDLMTRRCAVIALGVSGQREVLRRLVAAWHEGFLVSREVQRSLAMLGGVGVIDAVLDELPREPSPLGQAYLIETLGMLLAHPEPGLDRMGEGRVFAHRDDLLGQYRSIGEPFLYSILIPRLEDEGDEGMKWR